MLEFCQHIRFFRVFYCIEVNNRRRRNMDKSQVKSKKRVTDHGEVFTAEREVKAMCDLVNDEAERIDSRFLEPACGNGNFLAEIITRKLSVVKSKYGKSKADFEKNSFLAITSIYGVDILLDNCIECRKRLFSIWSDFYKSTCKTFPDEEISAAIAFILDRNIVCGNALSLCKVSEDGSDTDEPIIFSEWSFVTSLKLKRRDFRLDVLLKENEDASMYDTQLSLFGDDANGMEYWMIDPVTKETIPKPIKEFPIVHYRKVLSNE